MSQSRGPNGDLLSFDGNKELIQRHSDAADPGVTDDEGEGYEVGSLWINSTEGRTFMCLDATDGAAVWREEVKNNAAATSPGVTNDIDEGYSVGSTWVETVEGRVFVCMDNTDGAAVWREQVKNNTEAAADPGVTNDIDEGYSINSMWTNETDDGVFICTNNADGAAVWKEITFV